MRKAVCRLAVVLLQAAYAVLLTALLVAASISTYNQSVAEYQQMNILTK